MKGKGSLSFILAGSLLLSGTGKAPETCGLAAASTPAAAAVENKDGGVFTVYRGKSAALSIRRRGRKVKTGKRFRYRVRNKKIAAVSGRGRVKGKKAGTTTVILQEKSDAGRINVKIRVVDYVKGLRVKPSDNMALGTGEKKKIRAAVRPRTAKNRKIKYISSDKGIAKVSASGTVRAVKSGSATITVRTRGTTKKGKRVSKKIRVYVGDGIPTQPDISGISEPDDSTLLAARFVVRDGAGISTLYFVNRRYRGQVHLKIDGMEMGGSGSVEHILHRLATEITGKGVSVSVNPGDKRENKYFDRKYKRWRDAITVSRKSLSDDWLITDRKNGRQYRLRAWERDEKYRTPYGLIVAKGDTTSQIVVY